MSIKAIFEFYEIYKKCIANEEKNEAMIHYYKACALLDVMEYADLSDKLTIAFERMILADMMSYKEEF